MTQPHAGHQRGPRHRLSADQFSTADELLTVAAVVAVPDGLSQRQAFEKLMPQLYILRSAGGSFEQITQYLNDAGFKLLPSSVRTYYSKLLPGCIDLCQAQLKVYRERDSAHPGYGPQVSPL